jgi:hypothetical protein
VLAIRRLAIRRLSSDRVPKVTCFIIDEQVTAMFLVDLVHLKFVRMNGNVRMHFSKKVMNRCVNYVTDSTADDVQWNFSFVQYLKEPSCEWPENKVGLLQSFGCLIQSYLVGLEQFSLDKVKLVDKFVLF